MITTGKPLRVFIPLLPGEQRTKKFDSGATAEARTAAEEAARAQGLRLTSPFFRSKEFGEQDVGGNIMQGWTFTFLAEGATMNDG